MMTNYFSVHFFRLNVILMDLLYLKTYKTMYYTSLYVNYDRRYGDYSIFGTHRRPSWIFVINDF